MDSAIEDIGHEEELTRVCLGDGENNHTSFLGELREQDVVALFVLENEVGEDGSHGDGALGRVLGGGAGLGVVGVVGLGL